MKHRYDPSADSVGRRRLLRAGGAAIAAAAGAGVVAAATPAQATDGQPILHGRINTTAVNDTTTEIQNNGPDNATLKLFNPATSIDEFGLTVGGPTLLLQPNPTADYVDGPLGSLGMDQFGRIWAKTLPDPEVPEFVRTQFNTTEVVPLRPTRVLDTLLTKGNVINPAVIDSSGKLVGQQTLHLDLSDFVIFGTIVFANIAVLRPINPGFMIVFPFGQTRPTASNLNWSPGWTIANSMVMGLGHPTGVTRNGLPVTDAVSIFSSQTTRLVFDITAFTVWDPQQINPAILPPAAAAPSIAKLTPELRAAAARRGFRLKNPG
jgi:hypothetical protein